MFTGGNFRLAGLALGVVLVGLGLGWNHFQPAHRPPAYAALAPAEAEQRVRTMTPDTPAPQALAPPVRLIIPSQGVSAPVVPMGLQAHGQLALPANPATVGWWRDGALPGSSLGSAVISGHVDSRIYGRGALFRLADLKPGEEIDLATAEGATLHYRVAALAQYHKASLPAADVFSQTVPGRLVIITCGGSFDQVTRHYQDNVVVYAALTSP